MKGNISLKRLSIGPITAIKNKDVGLVLTLVFLLCFLRFDNRVFILLALSAVLIAIIIPSVLKPISYAWFGLSELLGTVMSKVLLILVFFLIITPIGTIRRIISKERLQMERWKKDNRSVFTVRDKTFTGEDVKNPF